MFKMREPRKYIRIYETKEGNKTGIKLENGGLYIPRKNLHVINV